MQRSSGVDTMKILVVGLQSSASTCVEAATIQCAHHLWLFFRITRIMLASATIPTTIGIKYGQYEADSGD